MENQEVKNNEATTEKTTKVNRRGIRTAVGTTKLKFSHEHAQKNGLFITHIESVEVRTIKIDSASEGMPSFAGLEIPQLVVTFASNEKDINARKYVSLKLSAVESNVETIPGGKGEWKVNVVFDWMKHLYSTFVKTGFTAEQEDALTLPYEDFNENKEYIPVEPEEVVAGWKLIFENFANIMNTGKNGKPVYKTDKNEDIAIWTKLIRYNKTKKGWTAIANGNLAFPTFVKEGVIEIYKQNVLPIIRIDKITERITIIMEEATTTAKTPNIGGIQNPIMGGVVADTNMAPQPMPDMGEDMPF